MYFSHYCNNNENLENKISPCYLSLVVNISNLWRLILVADCVLFSSAHMHVCFGFEPLGVSCKVVQARNSTILSHVASNHFQKKGVFFFSKLILMIFTKKGSVALTTATQ